MAQLDDIKKTLGREVGPFSVGAWLLIIGGGLGLGLLAGRAFGGGPETLPDLGPDGGAGDLSAGGRGGTFGGAAGRGPGGVSLPDGSAPGSGSGSITTNSEWSSKAVTWLVSQGESAVSSTEAVTAWLYGTRHLTDAEKALIDKVVSGIGGPPEAVAPAPPGEPDDPSDPDPVPGFDRQAFFDSQRYPVTLPTAPAVPVPAPAPQPRPAPVATASPVATAPASVRQHTVAGGDTLSSIARRFGTTWPVLYRANRAVIGSNPNLIFPGQVLVIPN